MVMADAAVPAVEEAEATGHREGAEVEGTVVSALDREEVVWPVAPWGAVSRGKSAGSMALRQAQVPRSTYRAVVLRGQTMTAQVALEGAGVVQTSVEVVAAVAVQMLAVVGEEVRT